MTKILVLFPDNPLFSASFFPLRLGRLSLLAAGLILALGAWGSFVWAQNGGRIETLGVPVKAVTFGNSHGVLARSPSGLPDMFYIPYYSTSGGALVGIHPANGEHVLIKLPSHGGYGCAVGTDGALYIGGIAPGNLYRFDPQTAQLDNLGGAQLGIEFIWDLVASADGKIYGACYPTGNVLEYDLATRQLRDLGRLMPQQQYVRSICLDAHGHIWGGTGAGQAHLIVLDPKTGYRGDVLPEAYRKSLFAYDLHAQKDYIYCALSGGGAELLVFDADTHLLRQALPPPPGEIGWLCGNSAEEGVLYPYTWPSGDLYRFEARTGKLERIAESLGQIEIVGEGRFAHTIQDQDYVYYDLRERKELYRRRVADAAGGMVICALTAGADGHIYGSTYINQHLFRVAPDTGEMTDLGRALRIGGQIDSMHGGRDGKIYLGAYVRAHMAVYDPALPWRPGNKEDSNPRELGFVPGQYRTRCIVLGPDNNVYMGTIPSYGSAPKGALARWERQSGKITAWTDLVPGGAVEDLRADDRWLYGVGGGQFFVLDVAQMQKVFTAPLAGSALEIAGNGLVIISAGEQIAIFDPRTMQLKEPLANPIGGLAEMTRLPDGAVAGINGKGIVRIEGETGRVTQLSTRGGSVIAADKQGRLYFASGATLLRLTP